MPLLEGQFPLTIAGDPIQDKPDDAAGWSTGGQAIVKVSPQQSLGVPWIVDAWSIQCQGAITPFGNFPPPAGRLGKLLASLILGAPFTPTGNQIVAYSAPPQSALPNLVTIWDGSQDPPFPQSGAQASAGVLSVTTQLSQPQTLSGRDQLGIGLWLTPSIVQGIFGIFIFNITYAVLYHTLAPAAAASAPHV